MTIAFTSSQLRTRGVRDSDELLALREAVDDEPHNATITLACGRVVRVWLTDSERTRLGFKSDEPRMSWCAAVRADDDAPRATHAPQISRVEPPPLGERPVDARRRPRTDDERQAHRERMQTYWAKRRAQRVAGQP